MKLDLRNSLEKPWVKKAGIFGFLFFLIKGLIWIIIFLATMWGLLGNI
ncbi:hypothetical protein BH10BAC5_BH10BAC5_27540 [soil metagenome]